VANGFLRIGPVRRGFGPGPAGKGWPVALPRLSGAEEPPGDVHLHDRSLAIASQADHPLPGAAGSYLNLRTGRPGLPGVVAVAASTELALDAQGLATTMLISGPRQGQIRLGSLSPRPSVLWFMGSEGGPLLMVDYRWSDVDRKTDRK
jgi:thiamine biosynthesis lipoprotein ApbE